MVFLTQLFNQWRATLSCNFVTPLIAMIFYKRKLDVVECIGTCTKAMIFMKFACKCCTENGLLYWDELAVLTFDWKSFNRRGGGRRALVMSLYENTQAVFPPIIEVVKGFNNQHSSPFGHVLLLIQRTWSNWCSVLQPSSCEIGNVSQDALECGVMQVGYSQSNLRQSDIQLDNSKFH